MWYSHDTNNTTAPHYDNSTTTATTVFSYHFSVASTPLHSNAHVRNENCICHAQLLTMMFEDIPHNAILEIPRRHHLRSAPKSSLRLSIASIHLLVSLPFQPSSSKFTTFMNLNQMNFYLKQCSFETLRHKYGMMN